MKTELCTSRTQHGPHDWTRLLRSRRCPGLVVAFCGRAETHPPHFYGEYHDELCNGSGLAGRCEHGVGFLNACDECPEGFA